MDRGEILDVIIYLKEINRGLASILKCYCRRISILLNLNLNEDASRIDFDRKWVNIYNSLTGDEIIKEVCRLTEEAINIRFDQNINGNIILKYRRDLDGL